MPDRRSERHVPQLYAPLAFIARSMNGDQFEWLAKQLQEHPQAFGYSKSRFLDFKKHMGIDQAPTRQLLEALEFIYLDLRENANTEDEAGRSALLRFYSDRVYGAVTEDDIRNESQIFGEHPDAETPPERLFRRLLVLLQPNAHADHKYKMSWLRTGIIPTATEFSTFADLRMDFDADRTGFDSSVIAIIFRVITNDDTEGEKSIHFQVTEEGLTRMKNVIEDAERKIELTRENPNFKVYRSDDE